MIEDLLTNSDKKHDNCFFDNFLKKVPVSLAFFSVDGTLIHMNKHFSRSLELTEDDQVKFQLESFLNNDKSKIKKIRAISNRTIEYYSDEIKYESKNGHISKWYKFSLFLDQDVISDEDTLVLVAQNISKTKNALERSMKNEVLLNSINENSNEGIFYLSKNKGFEFVNKAFLVLFGFTSFAELNGISFYQLFVDKEKSIKMDNELNTVKTLQNTTIQFIHKNGSTFWGALRITRFKNHEGRLCCQGTIVDVSEQKAKDELLVSKNQELADAKQQLDRLLYSASHDLRSPIAGLQGLINLMGLEFDHDDQHMAYLSRMSTSVEKLDRVIEGINSYAINTKSRRVSSRIDLTKMIDDTVSDLAVLNNQHKLNFIIHQGREIPFFSDGERLKVILRNIISNAIRYHDYNKKGSFVKIQVSYLSEKVIITISDNGLGIAKPYINKVFDMFYRANNERTGSGLGLYIVKETLLKLEGKVTLDSELNEGTKVTIEIPNDPKGRLMSKKLILK